MKPTTKLAGAVLAVEENDTDLNRYKRVHAYGCKGCKDPERVNVDAYVRTGKALAALLVGHAVTEDENDMTSLNQALMPCARKALAL